MIQRQGWYGVMAVLGLVVALFVGLAVAQDLDEDGLIVSEEMLVEDAVNGTLDVDVDDLLAEDALEDVDDLLLGDDLLSDTEEEEGVPAKELLDELLDTEAVDTEEALEPEASAEFAEGVDDLIVEPATVSELVVEAAPAASVDVADQAATNLEAGNDLDLLVERTIQEALAEAPVLDMDVADVEPEPEVEVEPEPEVALDVEPEPEMEPEAEVALDVEAIPEAVVDADDELMMDDVDLEIAEDLPLEDAVDEDMVVIDDESLDELLDDDFDEADVVDEDVVEMVKEVPEEEPVEEIVEDVVEVAPPEMEPEPIPEPVVAEISEDMAGTLDVMLKQEELRRQAHEAHGREVLRDAEKSATAHDYKEAERQFEEALRYITDRPETHKTRDRIRSGMARNYFAWASASQRKNKIDAARELGHRALGLKHPGAARFLEKLDTAPPPVAAAPVVEHRRARQQDFIDKQASIKELLRSGRQHLINGEFDRAQNKFEAVLQPSLDPQNTEAIRMIQKVAQKRYDRASMELEGTRRDMLNEVRRTWNPRDYGLAEAVASKAEDVVPPDPGTKGIRDRIRLKMESIKLPEVDFRQANIHDVIDFLQRASVDYDSSDVPDEEKGVNIILNLGQGDLAEERVAVPSDDPFAGMLEDEGGAAGSGGVPRITFTARYISLMEALKVVTQVSNLKYRIEGSFVMIVPFNFPDGDIVVRMYDVLPAVEERISVIGSDLGGPGSDRGGGDFISLDSTGVNAGGADWKAFFSDMGVQWPDQSSIKYVRTIGKIVVANTEKNLAVFEKVLEVLNVVPFQIEIEARFVEVTQTDLDSLGFEWMLNDTWEVAQKAGQAGLPAAARQRIEISAGQGTQLTGGNRYVPEGLSQVGQSVSALDSVLKISSVLTNPELSMVLHMLQQRGHADLLSAPKVTTKSGHEAQIKVVTEYIYPTEFEVTPITAQQDGVSTIVGGVVEPSTFETREVGVILSVLPEVSTEGQTINLNMTPEVVSDPTWYEYGSKFTDADGNEQLLAMPQPFFHTRSVNTSISIYNGATVVMGGMITERRSDVDDKIPFLGDIPLIGRLFRSSYEHSEKRNLLIFVTARLVDPNGLPIKKTEDVPLPDMAPEAAE